MSYHIGQTIRLSASLATARGYRWNLWDGTCIVTEIPYVDVPVYASGTLAYTCTAFDAQGNEASVGGTLTVAVGTQITATAVTGNGGVYGTEISVSVTVSSSPTSYAWVLGGSTVSGTSTNCTVKLTEDARLRYTCADSYGNQETVDFDLYGFERPAIAVSAIVASPYRGRDISGQYTDFSVVVKDAGYTCSWNLGGYLAVSLTDSVTQLGGYLRYKTRIVNSDRGTGTTIITFSASDGVNTRISQYEYNVYANANPSYGKVSIAIEGVDEPTGITHVVDDGAKLTLSLTDVSDYAWNEGPSDLVRVTWNVNSTNGGLLPVHYGKTISVDTTGYAGSTLSGTAVVEDPYGGIVTIDLDDISVERTPFPSLELTQDPESTAPAGVPIIVKAEPTGSIWNSGLRYSTPSYNFGGNVTSSTTNGAVIATSGKGGQALTATSSLTDVDGKVASASITHAVSNRLPTSVVVWNDAPGNKVESGTTVHFYACAIDLDGDSPLVFEWNFTNPVSNQTGVTATVATGSNLVGTKIEGTLNVYDPVSNVLRTSSSVTSVTVPDVLVLSSMTGNTGEVHGEDGYPVCSTCSTATVELPAPIVAVSGSTSVYIGIEKSSAFHYYYSGLSVASIRRTIVGNGYACDSGWTAAPSPTSYSWSEDWSLAFNLSDACEPWYGAATTGTYTLTLEVQLSDGTSYTSSLEVAASPAKFTNTYQGTVTATCPSGSCGSGASVAVVAAYDSTTTNQTFEDLGLNPETATAETAQSAVNSRAVAIATALANSMVLSEPACYAISDTCVCGTIGTDLDGKIVAKWSGDRLTAAQAAAAEISLGNWNDYITTIGGVSYTFGKTQVTQTTAMLCFKSALTITPQTYITLVFDSSGSMNTTLAPLQELTASPDGKLYRALSDTYGEEYSVRVRVISDPSERWVGELQSHIQPSVSSPSREQIVMVFQDEDSNYDSSPANLTSDLTLLYNTVTDAALFDFYVGALFCVTGNTPYVGDRWDTLYAGNTNFAALVNATPGSIAKLTVVKSVTGGSTTDYYFGLIQTALSNLGITIEDPDA